MAELTKQKRDLTYENSLLRIRLKAKRAPREILISGNFVTAMQQKAIPGQKMAILGEWVNRVKLIRGSVAKEG